MHSHLTLQTLEAIRTEAELAARTPRLDRAARRRHLSIRPSRRRSARGARGVATA